MGRAAQPVVLVVEDNAETADVLRRILVLRGYRVVEARDGVDALEMLHNGLQPTAIVLDVAMPNLDGRAFRSALLAAPAYADIPVVVYTAIAATEDIPRIVGYVRKGLDNPDVLLGFLEAACARGAQNRATRSRSSS